MLDLPSPSEIKYFQQLANTKHITRASELLGVTQPALSSAIKRLEEKLGVSLLLRSKKGVELTAAGYTFLEKSWEINQLWEQLSLDVKDKSESLRDSYKLGVHPSVAIICLPLCLGQLQKLYPETNLQVSHKLSRGVNEQILKKEVDFGIVVNPRRHPELVLKKLCEDEVRIWKKGKRSSDLLIYDPNLFQSSYILQKLRGKHSYANVMEVESLELIRELGMAGVGDVVLPTRVAHKPYSSSSLLALEESPIFKDEFFFVWNVNSNFNQKEKDYLRSFVSLLKEGLK
jgi:DNA-binding transcriptional LysR family regulator